MASNGACNLEERQFVLEYRSADGHAERFPALAIELVHLKVDVIGDPLATGLVQSLAHPGGNVTGLNAYAAQVHPHRRRRRRDC